MAKYVIDTCDNVMDAKSEINRLLEEGYPKNSISIIANDLAAGEMEASGVDIVQDFDYNDNDESLWERVKNFFGFDDDNTDYSDMLAAHRDEVRNGSILIVVDDALVPAGLSDSLSERDVDYWNRDSVAETDTQKAPRYTQDADDETIRLEAERLNVDKQNVQAGEVVVKKRVVEENQTVNVPLRHEEVVIERRPVTEGRAADGDFDDETITIPLWEEKANVTKQPVVTEEVHIAKTDVENTQQVNATVRREELDLDKTGNVVIKDDDTTAPNA